MIEANPIALSINEDDEGTDRLIHWHDTRRIQTIWRRAFAHSIEDPPWLGKWLSDTWRQVRFAAHHTQYWAWNSTRHGEGHDMIFQMPSRTRQIRLNRGMGSLNDGYIPPDHTGPMSGADAKDYEYSLKKKLRLGNDLDLMDSASQAQIKHHEDVARARGAKLVVVAPPSVVVKTFQPILSPDSGALFLDFSDPKKFPELFAPRARMDGNHLTFEGSILFTKLIARELAAALQEQSRGSGHTPAQK